jgi:hypothetical protein
MGQELTKEACIQKYGEFKLLMNGEIPEYEEFLKFASIPTQQLARLWGASPYSKLQTAAGDVPNKLKLKRTPLETIMHQYGRLVTELAAVPSYPEWDHRGMRPTREGLRKSHDIKWSEFPQRFLEWVEDNNFSEFQSAVEVLRRLIKRDTGNTQDGDRRFSGLIREIRNWTPARRRNSEGEYKIELRKHLESLKYELNEEVGESNFDLLVCREYAIEMKKDPDQAEYDRLFGQVARHLQHQRKVIVLIFQASRKDKLDNFTALIDTYLNLNENFVEVIVK